MNNKPTNINKFSNVLKSPLKLIGLVAIILIFAGIVTGWTYTTPPLFDCVANGTCYFGNMKINETTLIAQFFQGDASNLTAVPAAQLTGTAPLAAIPATLTGKDADTVDGYHLNQDTRTTASPTFVTVNANVSASNITSGRIPSEDRLPNTSMGIINASRYANFQDVINASDTNNDGYAEYPIYLPAGEYNFSTYGQMVLINNSVVYGAGQNLTIIRMPTNAVIPQPALEGNEDLDYAMITNKRPAGHLGERNITIRDMTLIWGNETLPSWASLMYYGNGISIFGAVDLEISGVTVINPPSFGIWVKGFYVDANTSLPTNAKIHHNTVINAGRDQDTLVGGIILTNVATHSRVTENYVYNSTNGIVLEDRSSNIVVSSNNVNTCRNSANASGIREITAWGKDIFSDNIVENCYAGIAVHGTISSTFSGNVINQTTDDGIRITSGSDSIYHDNVIAYTKTAINESIANSRNKFYNNDLYLSNTNKINQTGSPKASWAWQNYGVAPFFWGNLVVAPTEYGAPWGNGDSYYNTSSNNMCWNRNGWMNATGDEVVC